MKLVLQFDLDADIIDVPEYVVENKDLLRKQFIKWLYAKSNKHNYWVIFCDESGRKYRGIKYRSDAFLEWLNKKILAKESEQAILVAEHVYDYSGDLPIIYF